MNSLKSHLLISTPHMNDDIFRRSVIYICEHNLEGAFGLIINKPIDNVSLKYLKNIEVSNSDESTQIAVQLFSEIESFEINTPNRKTLQFFLRNSQLVAKNSISVEDEIDIVQTEEKNPKEKDIIYEKEQPRNANNKLIVIAGLIVSAIDITNSTSFSAGALIAIIANFL